MKLNYTYGQPSLMVKNITKNGYYAWNGKRRVPLNIAIKDNTVKLKGWFIPNIFLGFGISIKDNWNSFNNVIRMLIAACYIDYMVVSKALSIPLSEPEPDKIKSDIDTIIFNRESFKSDTYSQFMEVWNNSYNYIISVIRNKVIECWEERQPCEEIRNLFTNSYTYKVRRTKWKWLDGKSEDEIAKELFDMGSIELDKDIISALKHRHLSVKCVLDSLNKLVDTLPTKQKEELTELNNAKEWVNTLNNDQIIDIHSMLAQQDVTLELMLIRAYHMDISISPEAARKIIKEYYDNIVMKGSKYGSIK